MTYGELIPVYLPGPRDDRPAVRSEIVQTTQGNNRRPSLGDRVGEVFGLARTWPDEVMVPRSQFLGSYLVLTRLFNLTEGDATAVDILLGEEPIEQVRVDDILISQSFVVPPGGTVPVNLSLARAHVAIDSLQLEPAENSPFERQFTPWFLSPGRVHVADINLGGPSIGNVVGQDVTAGPWNVRIEWQPSNANGDELGPITEIDFSRTDGSLETRIYTNEIAVSLPPAAPEWILVRMADSQAYGGTNFLSRNKFWHSFIGREEFENPPVSPRSTLLIVLFRSRHGNRNLRAPVSATVLRNLPFTVLDDGTVQGPSPQFTQRATDIYYHLCRDADHGDTPPELIDAVQIGQVKQRLDAIDGGLANRFNATFEGRSTVGADMQLVAHVMRSTATRHGEFCTLYRDQAEEISSLFTNRNKAKYESVDFDYDPALQPDGIEVEYVDADLLWTEQRVVWPFDSPRVNLRKIKLPGGNRTQALRRAIYEFERQRGDGSRIALSTRREGNLLRIFNRIVVADEVEEPVIAGEAVLVAPTVLKIDRDVVITLPGDVEPPAGQVVWLRGPDGLTVQEVQIVAIDGRLVEVTPAVTLAPPPDGAQTRMLYAMEGPTAARTKAWTVQGLNRADSGGSLELAPYDPDLYRMADEMELENNVIVRHEPWLVEWSGDSMVASGDPWPPLTSTGPTLVQTDGTPVGIDVGTAPLDPDGLGTRRVDKAIAMVTGGSLTANDFGGFQSGLRAKSVLWIRYIMNHLSPSGGAVFQLVDHRADPVYRINLDTVDGGATERTTWRDALGEQIWERPREGQGTWRLVDMIFDPAAGFVRVYENGVASESGSIFPAGKSLPWGYLRFGVMCFRGGGTPSVGTLCPWLGYKTLPTAADLTLEQHTKDAEALGITVLGPLDRYAWDWEFSGEDATVSVWPEKLGIGSSPILVASNNDAVINQPTTGLNADAITPARVDKGVMAGTTPYRLSPVPGFWPGMLGQDVHFRFLFIASAITNNQVFSDIRVGGSAAEQNRNTGKTIQRIEFAWRSDSTGGNLTILPTIPLSGWVLVDLNVRYVGGDTILETFVNGTQTTASAVGLTITPDLNDASDVSILGSRGNVPTTNLTQLFWAARRGTMSEAQHNSDRAELGL